MNSTQATFEVTKVFGLSSRSAVILQGEIRSGTVLAGMSTKVLVDSQLYMTAEIKGVEFIDGPGRGSTVGLVLDTPDPEVRELWLALCQPGDLLPVASQP
jgi:hypothetical protein